VPFLINNSLGSPRTRATAHRVLCRASAGDRSPERGTSRRPAKLGARGCPRISAEPRPAAPLPTPGSARRVAQSARRSIAGSGPGCSAAPNPGSVWHTSSCVSTFTTVQVHARRRLIRSRGAACNTLRGGLGAYRAGPIRDSGFGLREFHTGEVRRISLLGTL
jgi:hypothetical protein